MGLNYSLLTLREYEQIISDIEELWIMKRHDMKFKFILPQLIHTAKWKFDYIIFRNILKMATVECKTCHSNAHIPRRAYQGSVGYDLTKLFVADTKVLKPWGRALIKLDCSIAIQEGYYGQIVGHSGLAITRSIIVTTEQLIRIIGVWCAWSFSVFPTRNIWYS